MKLLGWLILPPLAVLMIAFAIANRQLVTIDFNPLPFTLDLPVFILVYLGVLIGLVAMLVLDVLWQVASRYLLRNPSSWGGRLGTPSIIRVTMLGASVAFIRNDHLGIDYFVGKWSTRNQLISGILVQVLVGLFATLVLILGGLKLVALTLLTEQVSPALGVRIGHVYLALPISGVVILLVAFQLVVNFGGTFVKQKNAPDNEDDALPGKPTMCPAPVELQPGLFHGSKPGDGEQEADAKYHCQY